MRIGSPSLAAAALAIGAALAGLAPAQALPPEPLLAELPPKTPSPQRPSDGCYYGVKCVNSARYGQICWRVACPRAEPVLRR